MADAAPTMKCCTLCNEDKPLDAFSPAKKGKHGRASRCKPCAVRLALERGSKISVSEKRCACCGQVKASTEFYKNKASTDGLHSRCKVCHRVLDGRSLEARQRERAVQAVRLGKAYATAADRRAVTASRRRELEQGRQAAKVARDTKRAEAAISRQLRDKIKNQIKKKRRLGHLDWRIRDSLCNDRWSPMILNRLGYTVAELKRHIEKQFTKGMDWSAFQRGEIHIDHIVPVRCFDLKQEAEVMACWTLTNLQPLWAADNLAKGGKRLVLV